MQSPLGTCWIFIVLCGLALQQPFAAADSEEESMHEKRKACFKLCGDYIKWGHDCAVTAKCHELQHTDEAAYIACYQACTRGGATCLEVCANNYDDLTESCDNHCEDASFVEIFCEDNCLKREFKAQFSSSLPDLTSQDVGVWQGIPFLDKSESEETEEEDVEETDD